MPVIWRLVLAIYNLILLAIAALAVAVSLGETEPLHYINLLAASPENRIICGSIGMVVFILALLMLYSGLRKSSNTDAVLVDKSLLGEVSMTIEAIKLIIMKAVRQVDGVKDIRSEIKKSPGGLAITLHMMINPDISVPEMTSAAQKIVKEYLENIGGLQIAEIKIRVEDFHAGK